MVLAWTIADARYRFRIKTAPLPMDRLTFAVVAAVGVLTLLTDLWRAQQWPVPVGPLPPAAWQALLGGLFLLTFLSWAWFGFIVPPKYGKLNAKRYAESLYWTIMSGSPPQLAIAAKELSRSAEAIVHHATGRSARQGDEVEDLEDVSAYANELLLLIADRRFCRAVVASSPSTVGVLFEAVRQSKKYDIPIDLFGKNIVTEAIRNRDSFLYHEASGYDSGLLGYAKPLTTVMFSDFDLIEQNSVLLTPGYSEARKWEADQWGAYSRIVLIALKAHAERGLWWGHGFSINQATALFAHAVADLYKLDGVAASSWEDDIQARLWVVVDFIEEAVKTLDEVGVPSGLARRVKRYGPASTCYDQLADLVSHVVFAASAVKSPRDLCWWIQHNSLWGELTHHSDARTDAWGTLLFKVRRLLYDDIVELERFPNFKGARILGFCLNVLGFEKEKSEFRRQMRPLHRAVLAWTRANFARLHEANPEVADACLVDGITYDEAKSRLVRTYPKGGLSLEAQHIYFDVEPLGRR